jgi:TonB family protein
MIVVAVSVLAAFMAQEPAAATSPAQPVRVGSGVQPPKKIKHVPPKYPEEARRAGLRGRVVLECQIDTTGAVVGTKVLEGVPPLTDATMEAVSQWRYTPTVLNGDPVPVIMTATVSFTWGSPLQMEELLDSLASENEFIRESAAIWLGGTRPRKGVSRKDISRISERLARLAEQDENERVRTAAAESVRRLEAR